MKHILYSIVLVKYPVQELRETSVEMMAVFKRICRYAIVYNIKITLKSWRFWIKSNCVQNKIFFNFYDFSEMYWLKENKWPLMGTLKGPKMVGNE